MIDLLETDARGVIPGRTVGGGEGEAVAGDIRQKTQPGALRPPVAFDEGVGGIDLIHVFCGTGGEGCRVEADEIFLALQYAKRSSIHEAICSGRAKGAGPRPVV